MRVSKKCLRCFLGLPIVAVRHPIKGICLGDNQVIPARFNPQVAGLLRIVRANHAIHIADGNHRRPANVVANALPCGTFLTENAVVQGAARPTATSGSGITKSFSLSIPARALHTFPACQTDKTASAAWRTAVPAGSHSPRRGYPFRIFFRQFCCIAL